MEMRHLGQIEIQFSHKTISCKDNVYKCLMIYLFEGYYVRFVSQEQHLHVNKVLSNVAKALLPPGLVYQLTSVRLYAKLYCQHVLNGN